MAADGPPVLASLRRRVVVSCQASPGSPMRNTAVIARIAASVVAAGAGGIRIDSPAHIDAVKKSVAAPLIGLWKDGTEGVYITPTLEHARAVIDAGADIVALDGTGRARPDGRDLAEVIESLHADLGAVVLADVGTVAEGVAAAQCGADAVATTFAELARDNGQVDSALDVVTELAARIDIPVIAEGGITSPDQARAAIDSGAWCVVIGKAITSPEWITARFAAAVGNPDGHAGLPRSDPQVQVPSQRATPLAQPEGGPCDI